MERGKCRLCLTEGELHESHIIPKFVFKWIKKAAPTPYLRSNESPDKRAQDGAKRYWLCTSCEQLFSGFERYFAEYIFHPTIEKGVHRIAYSRWLLKFCASLSWRALLMSAEAYGFATWPPEHRQRAQIALDVWRKFMLDEVEHPGEFEQHLMVFSAWTDGGDDVPRNINNYLQLAIELDIDFGPNIGTTFVKFGPFVIMGFFVLHFPNEWRSTKINLKHGTIASGKYRLPGAFRGLLIEKAEGHSALYKQISPNQKAVISEAWARQPGRVIDSRLWKVLNLDLALFGDEVPDAY